MYKNLSRMAAASAAVLALTVVVAVAPAASATDGTAYTTVITEGGCRLATIDLASGVVTPLPAGPSAEACVNDLAASEDQVLGVLFVPEGPIIVAPDASPGRAFDGPGAYLVDFDPATGTPTSTHLTVAGTDDPPSLVHGGVAIAPDGTVYAHLVSNAPGCSTDSVCLVTIDPATAVATPIGPSTLTERTMYELAMCDGDLHSFVRQDLDADVSRLAGGALTTWNAATGAAAIGSPLDEMVFGFDCAGATAHVLTGEFQEPVLREAEDYSSLDETRLGTLDLTTGDVTPGTLLSSELQGGVALLAIPVQTTPEPTTTTTTTAPEPTTTTTTRPATPVATAATPVSASPAYTG